MPPTSGQSQTTFPGGQTTSQPGFSPASYYQTSSLYNAQFPQQRPPSSAFPITSSPNISHSTCPIHPRPCPVNCQHRAAVLAPPHPTPTSSEHISHLPPSLRQLTVSL